MFRLHIFVHLAFILKPCLHVYTRFVLWAKLTLSGSLTFLTKAQGTSFGFRHANCVIPSQTVRKYKYRVGFLFWIPKSSVFPKSFYEIVAPLLLYSKIVPATIFLFFSSFFTLLRRRTVQIHVVTNYDSVTTQYIYNVNVYKNTTALVFMLLIIVYMFIYLRPKHFLWEALILTIWDTKPSI